jgi:hypothetical protein
VSQPSEGTPPASEAPATPEGEKPAATPPPSQAVTPEAIRAATELLERKAEADKFLKDKRDLDAKTLELHENAPELVRETLDKFEEEYDIRIPAAARKPLMDLVKELTTTAGQAAELQHGKALQQSVAAEQKAFTDACWASIDPAKGQEFLGLVNGKPHADWIKAAIQLAPKTFDVPALISEANTWATDPANGLNDAEQAQLAAATKGLKTAKSVIKAVSDAAKAAEKRAPGAPPVGGERSAPIRGDVSRLTDPHTPVKDLEAALAAAGVR